MTATPTHTAPKIEGAYRALKAARRELAAVGLDRGEVAEAFLVEALAGLVAEHGVEGALLTLGARVDRYIAAVQQLADAALGKKTAGGRAH